MGGEYNGILETRDTSIDFEHDGGTLQVEKLLPEDGVIRKVGGPDYRYYVEVDGDDSDLDGRNISEGASEKSWFDAGLWRLEIQPEEGRNYDEFLVLMKPGLEGQDNSFQYKKSKPTPSPVLKQRSP